MTLFVSLRTGASHTKVYHLIKEILTRRFKLGAVKERTFRWKTQFDQKSKDEASDDNHCKFIHHSSKRREERVLVVFLVSTTNTISLPGKISSLQCKTDAQ